jgi:hypothetical protein
MVSPAVLAILSPLPVFIARLPDETKSHRRPDTRDRCTVCEENRGTCRRHIRLAIHTWEPERSLLHMETRFHANQRDPWLAMRHGSHVLPMWVLPNQWDMPHQGRNRR